MSVKKRLEAFRAEHKGVDHLVFGDLASGMVLFGVSDEPKGQEAHDHLIAQAVGVLAGEAAVLADLSTDSGNGIQVIVSDATGTRIFSSVDAAPDEVLVLELARAAGAGTLGDAAIEILLSLAEEEE